MESIGLDFLMFPHSFNKHKSSIRKNSPGFSVAEHFNLADHSFAILRAFILFGNFKTSQDRRKCEIKFFLTLNTHMNGLKRN